jgi:tetratricopeptide (TPR) repeat protein
MALRESRRFAEAAEVHQQELAAAQRINDYLAQAFALDHLGLTWRELGGIAAAERAHARSAWLFEQVGHHDCAAKPLLHLGRIHLINDRFKQSIHHFAEAAFLFALYGDDRGEALALGNMAGPLILLGRHREAIEVCQNAVHLSDGEDGQYHRALALTNMGAAYAYLGLGETALDCYGAGARIFQQLGDHHNLAIALSAMSRILTQQGKFTEAREAQRQAEASQRHVKRASE